MQQTQPELTVIVPVFNRAQVVERTLDSIAAQTLRPFNLVIVDNNSTDDSVGVIERWACARRSSDSIGISVLFEPTPGAAAARNCGLRAARTPIVMFFDSDDVMDSRTFLQEVVDGFRANPYLDVLAWRIKVQKSNGKFFTTHRMSRKHPLTSHIIHTVLSTERYAVKREFIEQAGAWNEGVSAWDDYELGVRVLAAKPVISWLDIEPPVTTYYTPYSITDSNPTNCVNHSHEHALNCCEENLMVARCEKAIRWIDYRRAILAADYASGGFKNDAHRLLASIVSGHKFVYRLLYLKHRLFKRGTHLLVPFRRV